MSWIPDLRRVEAVTVAFNVYATTSHNADPWPDNADLSVAMGMLPVGRLASHPWRLKTDGGNDAPDSNEKACTAC
jgi:hypothetical protein